MLFFFLLFLIVPKALTSVIELNLIAKCYYYFSILLLLYYFGNNDPNPSLSFSKDIKPPQSLSPLNKGLAL